MASATDGLRFSNLIVLPKNWSRAEPVGPLRCLAQINSARPRFSSVGL